MGRYIGILFIITFLAEAEMYAQPLKFIADPVSFSSRSNDEFSPVFYKGGIVFCSNMSDNSLVSYNNGQNRLFKIVFVTKKGRSSWSISKILAEEITSGFNDGPVTFNDDGNVIYYSRNNNIKSTLRNISDTTNKLGIFTAELTDGKWINIRPFKYNNPLYSFYTPSLNPEGDRIYFSSDMPGGIGGMDIYYCDKRDNEWEAPVNLGPVINTEKNESFPFASKFGKLFFASDGHKGFGGKDLFYSQEVSGEWIAPVHLDSAINSPYDDFGIVTDSTSVNGYFSTNRQKSDDIFSFSSAPIDFADCDTIKPNNYCFTFYDEQHEAIDTLPVTYKWDFGDAIIKIGKEVRHCFPGPGKYIVKLSITDDLTGDAIAKQVNYDVELKNVEQAVIVSDNTGLANNPISFEGVTSDLSGITVTDYLWDFGDGFKQGGPLMSMPFRKKGEYTVRLGLVTQKDSLEVLSKICVMKKIKIN